jgi:hypothetical protein
LSQSGPRDAAAGGMKGEKESVCSWNTFKVEGYGKSGFHYKKYIDGTI